MTPQKTSQRSTIILILLNAVLLVCLGAQSKRDPQGDVQSLVRARAIELIDDRGTVRASMNVAENGEAVFRMRDSKGVIRLKLGTSEQGSALLLLDNSTDPALHVLAREKTTMTLKNKDGQMREITP
jgi:hypothetical protein